MVNPKIVHQPATHLALKNGISTIVNAIRPTFGPFPRHIIYKRPDRFELLDDGGLIARRIIQIKNRHEDVGAMLLRQVLWQVNQQVGDGTTTAAIIYEAVYNESLRYIAAGANAMRLRECLLQALQELQQQLAAMCRPIENLQHLKSVALSVCYDEEIAHTLSEVFDTIGEYGQVDIRSGHGRGIEYRYVEGAYWKGGVQSKEMLRGKNDLTAHMADAAILITDLDIEEPNDLVAPISLAIRENIQNVLLIVKRISERGLSVVLSERIKEKVNVVVVKIDSFVKDDITQAHHDMAYLTGARPILEAAGQSLERVAKSDFGYARWVWADDKNFGLAGGKGNPLALRQHVANLRKAYHQADDDDHRDRLLKRLGRLHGGLATVSVGGTTSQEIEMRKMLTERTVRALRVALSGGVLIGGGMALLNCRDALLQKAANHDGLEAYAAYQILAQACEAPIRALLSNAGYEPSEVLAKLQSRDSGEGINLLKETFVNMAEDGVYDVAYVQQEAVQRAVSGAAQALTIDVMVLHRNPETAVEP